MGEVFKGIERKKFQLVLSLAFLSDLEQFIFKLGPLVLSPFPQSSSAFD